LKRYAAEKLSKAEKVKFSLAVEKKTLAKLRGILGAAELKVHVRNFE